MEQAIKVLQVFTILNRGGAETNIMNYYRKLNQEKVQFDFLVHRQEIAPYEEEVIKLGAKIYRLPAFNPLKIKQYKKSIKLFFDEHQDYNIIHGNCSELGIYIYQEAKKRNIPVIIAHAHNATDGLNLKSPFRWYYKNKMRPFVNTYFSCSHPASIWLFGKKNAKKAFIMNNAIDAKSFAFDLKKDLNSRNNLNAENSLNILHVGRFNEQKNHSFMIDVFSALHKINPNTKLFLVGEGDLKTKIIEKVKNLSLDKNVVFLGSRSDVNDIAQAMDLYLFPSLFEGLPVSLVEAQAAGLKCIISDGIPKESILIPEHVTVVALKKSPQYWASQINNFSNHKKTDVSQLIIEKGYDINANVIILENKYLELLKSNS
ncbi:MAG: glycosyltransferase family 1 protein [Flavobacterium sp.]|nr:glycosyltransferase family 1 protein [Flavobacterium sp.]